MKLSPNNLRKIVIFSFLAVPILSSLISTIHIITFFGLGNMSWMAIILALAFEIGSIASLMTLSVLDKINRGAVWFIFFVLVVMQMLGNVYYTYDFISTTMMTSPRWIDSFIDLVEMMTMQKLEPRTTKFILSLLIGLPIPIISLAFLKSIADYLKPESEKEKSNELIGNIKNINEEIILTEKTENEDFEDQNKKTIKPEYNLGINNQITDSVTLVESFEELIEDEPNDSHNEIEITEKEIKKEKSNEIPEEPIFSQEAEIDYNVDLENVELEEKKEDIYIEIEEEEPEESFFDDSTVEEEYDNFKTEEDGEKKNLL